MGSIWKRPWSFSTIVLLCTMVKTAWTQEAPTRLQNGSVVCVEERSGEFFCSNGDPAQIVNPGNSVFSQFEKDRSAPGGTSVPANEAGTKAEEVGNEDERYYFEQDYPYMSEEYYYKSLGL